MRRCLEVPQFTYPMTYKFRPNSEIRRTQSVKGQNNRFERTLGVEAVQEWGRCAERTEACAWRPSSSAAPAHVSEHAPWAGPRRARAPARGPRARPEGPGHNARAGVQRSRRPGPLTQGSLLSPSRSRKGAKQTWRAPDCRLGTSGAHQRGCAEQLQKGGRFPGERTLQAPQAGGAQVGWPWASTLPPTPLHLPPALSHLLVVL